MKISINLILITILVIFLYYNPSDLSAITSSVLGKLATIVLICYIASMYGTNTGIIAALIFILLMHNQQEGMKNKTPKGKARHLEKGVKKNKQSSPVSSKGPTPTNKKSTKKKVVPALRERIKNMLAQKQAQKKPNRVDLENVVKKSGYLNSKNAKKEKNKIGFEKHPQVK